MASAAARRSRSHQGEVTGFDGDVGAVAHRDAEIGLRQRGRVVDAVADHGDDATLGLQAGDRFDLAGGRHVGDHIVVGNPDLRPQSPAAVARLSPVSSIGCSPSERNAAIRLERGRS